MTTYNKKINSDGSYRKYFGWTVISPIINDMKILQNFVEKNNVLKKHFSALPSSSYHVTILGIWSNMTRLLKQQKKYIETRNTPEEKDLFKSLSISQGLFNPGNCLNKLFSHLTNDCTIFKNKYTKTTPTIKLIVKQVYFGGTIGILFQDTTFLGEIRDTLVGTSKIEENGMYHLTLAYKYVNTSASDNIMIKKEIDILNMLLTDQVITLDYPILTSFDSMKSFKPL
jgi:hypothetical protein